MLKVWLPVISFTVFIEFGLPLICEIGCNIFSKFIASTLIAILFHISLYNIITHTAETLKIEMDEKNKSNIFILTGIIALIIFIAFLIGFHSIESVKIINLTK